MHQKNLPQIKVLISAELDLTGFYLDCIPNKTFVKSKRFSDELTLIIRDNTASLVYEIT